MTKEEIGKIIHDARKNKKMSLQDVGKIIGVSAAAISRWESGEKNILGENLIKIAEVLNIVHLVFPGYEKVEKEDITPDDMQKLLSEITSNVKLLAAKQDVIVNVMKRNNPAVQQEIEQAMARVTQ